MIRRATIEDVPTIARLRQAMWDEMNPDRPAAPAFIDATSAYWTDTFGSGRGVGWLAEHDDVAVGMAMLLINHQPPRPFGEIRRGYVTSVYVAPEHRRHGYGRALMLAMIEYGRAEGLQRLELRSTEVGRELYEVVGFRNEGYMLLPLDKEHH